MASVGCQCSGFEDYSARRLSELETVSTELLKYPPKSERKYWLDLSEVKPEMETEVDSWRIYKVTLKVGYWAQVVSSGNIVSDEKCGEVLVTERKKMQFLWGKWFILNSKFSVTLFNT